ncbi:MAG: hypothetical protein CVT62_11915 [Actinobacteria bacterium HGW-Actinobacteria-2]|nr:MAG: hypothetical protein CVT62_11915 [Actinobacteria bacterium HGW-Actinobacteria-2]
MVVLSVGLTASSFVPLNTMTAAVAPPSISAPGRAVGVTHSTNTSTVVVAFRSAQADAAGAATAATKQAAWDIAQATAVSARALRKDAAAVTFDTSLTREQATKISKAAAKNAAVKYAEPSVTFYPTDAGGSGYYWNVDQINASAAWASAGKGSSDVVVGVIDTGIDDNAQLPKALLLNTVDGKVDGSTVSGTTWPGLTVTLSYPSGGVTQTTTAVADSDGNWSATLSQKADDTRLLTASVTDASGQATTQTSATVNSSVNLKAATPSNGKTIGGTADTDTTLTVRVKDGQTLCTGITPSANDGTWSCSVALGHGTKVEVTAVDTLGNTDTQIVTVDAEVILTPDDPSDGNTITGTTDPGAQLTFTDAQGNTICETTTADSTTGAFTCTPASRLADGLRVTVTTTDEVKNTASRTITVNASVNLTVVSPSDGRTFLGTADDDTTITLKQGNTTLCAGLTPTNRSWTCTIASGLADGASVTVTATDTLGNTDTQTTTVDAQVALSVNPSNGKTITGTTDPRATVTFTTGGTSVCPPVTASKGQGSFTCTPTSPLADDTTVVVTSVDTLGNAAWYPLTVNASVHLTVVSPSNGKTFTGTADDDATVTVKNGNTTLCAGLAATSGSWTCTITSGLANGATATVTATDALANTDTQTIAVDAQAPILTVDPSDGKAITGTTEPGASVTVTDAQASTICTVTADNSTGVFTCTPSEALADGASVTVSAADSLGNTATATITVNKSVHLTVVSPSNGKTFTGTADTDATITAKVKDGDALCTDGIEVSGAGGWSCTVAPGLGDATIVEITATDNLGNSDTQTITVDAAISLTLADSDGSSISGTTDPGATVSFSLPDSAAACADQTADDNGHFACTPGEPLADATTVTVTATDAVGNSATMLVVTAAPAPEKPSGDASANESGTPSTAVAAPGTTVPLTSATVGDGTVLPGYDFVDNDTNATDPGVILYPNYTGDQPLSSHGTHVAGIIAASRSNTLTGVAPGVKIQPIRALPSGSSGTMTDVSAAIRWAVGQPVTAADGSTVTNPYAKQMAVLNLSLGAPTSCSDEMQGAINAALANDTTVVVSAGNDNESISSMSPANCAGVIVVTATDSNRNRASYSNWGTSETTSSALVAAPGGSGGSTSTCYTWYPGSYQSLAGSCTDQVVSTVAGSWMPKSGTSMAAPHVAGTAALLKSINPSLTPAQVARIIRGTATPVAGCATGLCGAGIVNAGAAVAAVAKPDDVTVAAASYPTITLQSVMGTQSSVGNVISVVASGGYPSVTYQWYRGSTPISGATSSWYQLTGADYGAAVWATVTTAGGGPSASSIATSVTGRASMSFIAKPKVSGTVKVGRRLSVGVSYTPVVAAAQASYQWYRSGKKISKATKSTYKLTKKDRGKKITVKVTLRATGYITISTTSAKTRAVKR